MVFHWLKESVVKNSSTKGKFKHLGIQERLLIAFFLKQGYSKADIAKELGVHRSTIYRELARNQDGQSFFSAQCGPMRTLQLIKEIELMGL